MYFKPAMSQFMTYALAYDHYVTLSNAITGSADLLPKHTSALNTTTTSLITS
jgi:hypothetical protein